MNGIVKKVNRTATGFCSAEQLGSALSIAKQTESLKLDLKGHPRMQSVMDESQSNATPSDLVAGSRRSDFFVVSVIQQFKKQLIL